MMFYACGCSLLHYAKLAVNGQTIVVWEELSPDSDDSRKPFLQTLAGAFEVLYGIGTLFPYRVRTLHQSISRNLKTRNALYCPDTQLLNTDILVYLHLCV